MKNNGVCNDQEYLKEKAEAARKAAKKRFRKACDKVRDVRRSKAREEVRGVKESYANSVVEAQDIEEIVSGEDE